MSEVIYAKEGKKHELSLIKAEDANYRIALFQNDITPNEDTEFTDMTDASFSGYPVGGEAPGWSDIITAGDGNAAMLSDTHTFSHDGGGVGNSIYGWMLYAIDGGDTWLIHAQRYEDAPRSISAEGNFISVTLQKRQGSCPEEV